MRNKLVKPLVGITAALFFLCGMTFAKSSNISLIYRGEIGNNLTLAPGTYRMVVNNHSQTPKVAFYQNGKLVGEAPVKLVSEAKKANQTEVFYSAPHNGTRNITQIDPSGWKDELVFSHFHSTGS